MLETAADGEDDTERHRGCEDSRHAGNGTQSFAMSEKSNQVLYLVTMVLTGSSIPVGFMMNQKNIFVMLTIQMALKRGE